MKLFWKALLSKTVRILDDVKGRELYFTGITIGWVGIGFIFGEKRAVGLDEKAHLGDPCIYCGKDWDKVDVGDCPNR